MLSLADTTNLLTQTTDQLATNLDQLTPQASVTRLNEWLSLLAQAENMKPVADELAQLKEVLETTPVDKTAVQKQLGSVADQVSLLSAHMGSEGEMPGLFDGLAAALRQVGSVARGSSS